MVRHEYDYPFTSGWIAAKGFVAGSLFFTSVFFPNPAIQLPSLILALFVAFDCCMPFEEYFYFGTFILSAVAGASLAFITHIFGYLFLYWIASLLIFAALAYRRSFLRWKNRRE